MPILKSWNPPINIGGGRHYGCLCNKFLALKSLPRRGNRYRWREQQEEETEEGTEEAETEGNQLSLYLASVPRICNRSRWAHQGGGQGTQNPARMPKSGYSAVLRTKGYHPLYREKMWSEYPRVLGWFRVGVPPFFKILYFIRKWLLVPDWWF